MQQIKGYTSKVLREEFAELSKMPSLWTRSYFVSTDGNVCRKSKEEILKKENIILESEVNIMANFIVEFPLKTEKYQEDILNKRFKIGRMIYNSLVNVTQKRYKEMIKTRKYRNLMSSLTGNKKSDKEIWKQINNIRKQYGMSEYSFHEDIKMMQKHFKNNIDSFTAQKIATTLWKSYDKLFFGNGKKVYFKRYGELNSLEGKSNKTGIRLINDTLTLSMYTTEVTSVTRSSGYNATRSSGYNVTSSRTSGYTAGTASRSSGYNTTRSSQYDVTASRTSGYTVGTASRSSNYSTTRSSGYTANTASRASEYNTSRSSQYNITSTRTSGYTVSTASRSSGYSTTRSSQYDVTATRSSGYVANTSSRTSGYNTTRSSSYNVTATRSSQYNLTSNYTVNETASTTHVTRTSYWTSNNFNM